MRIRTLWVVPSHVAMLAFSVVFLTCYDLYVESQGRLPVPVLAVNLCLYAVAGLTAVTMLRAAASATARDRILTLYRAHASVLLPLAAVVGASFVSAYSRTSYLDEGPRYVMYPAYGATVIILSMLLPFPDHRRRQFRWYLFAAFAVSVAAVLTDVWHPGTFSILPDRAAGFPRNPNGGGFLV